MQFSLATLPGHENLPYNKLSYNTMHTPSQWRLDMLHQCHNANSLLRNKNSSPWVQRRATGRGEIESSQTRPTTHVPGLPQKYGIPEEKRREQGPQLHGPELLLTQGHPSASGSQGLGLQVQVTVPGSM